MLLCFLCFLSMLSTCAFGAPVKHFGKFSSALDDFGCFKKKSVCALAGVNATSDCADFGDAVLRCDDDGDVTFLNLSMNELKGFVGSSVGVLTALKHLNLQNTGVKHQLPSQVGQLTSLTWLSLANNALNGTLPQQLSRLTAMTSFFVHGNKLTGAIPELNAAALSECMFVANEHPGNCFVNLTLSRMCRQLNGTCVCDEAGIKCHDHAVHQTSTLASSSSTHLTSSNAQGATGDTVSSSATGVVVDETASPRTASRMTSKHRTKTDPNDNTAAAGGGGGGKQNKPGKAAANSSGLGASIPVIVGVTVGVVFALALLALLIRLCILKRRQAHGVKVDYISQVDDL